MYFVGSRNGEGERDCGLADAKFISVSNRAGGIAVYAQFERALRIIEQKRDPNIPADRHVKGVLVGIDRGWG